MGYEDFETFYALGLDEVLIGEHEPTEEEKMLLSAIGAGFGFNDSEPGILKMMIFFFLGIGKIKSK